ncbi:MAG: hypothetical protein M1505_00455 [Patescibacteria group bacterium]|nr:hypothetical protein [Patescibacteria group bacterium]
MKIKFKKYFLENSKQIQIILAGLILTLTVSIVYIFAFQEPSQSPPAGQTGFYSGDSSTVIVLPLNVQATTTITNGVLGVGLTNPAATLDVAGTLNVSATSTFGGNVGIGVSIPNASLNVIGTVQLQGSGSNIGLNVSSNGNVGVGTTTPQALFQVWNTASSTIYIGDSAHSGCLAIGMSDGNVGYITTDSNGNLLVSTSTKPAVCQ